MMFKIKPYRILDFSKYENVLNVYCTLPIKWKKSKNLNELYFKGLSENVCRDLAGKEIYLVWKKEGTRSCITVNDDNSIHSTCFLFY